MSTPSIDLEPDLIERLDEMAHQTDTQISQLANEALSRYLDELNRHKIRAEGDAFRKMHAVLLQQYEGKYVAIHNGQVVDHDDTAGELSRRVRARFGKTPVLIQQVTDKPRHTLNVRSPWRIEPRMP